MSRSRSSSPEPLTPATAAAGHCRVRPASRQPAAPNVAPKLLPTGVSCGPFGRLACTPFPGSSGRTPRFALTGSVGVRGSSPLSSTSISGDVAPPGRVIPSGPHWAFTALSSGLCPRTAPPNRRRVARRDGRCRRDEPSDEREPLDEREPRVGRQRDPRQPSRCRPSPSSAVSLPARDRATSRRSGVLRLLETWPSGPLWGCTSR
jgi:hypothetical protein